MKDTAKQEAQTNATIARDKRVKARLVDPVAMLLMSNRRSSGTTNASMPPTREIGLNTKYNTYLMTILKQYGQTVDILGVGAVP